MSTVRLTSSAGLVFDLNANGSVRRIDYAALLVNLFPGSELEGGPANLYLRRRGASPAVVALLGPESPARFAIDETGLDASGDWQGLRFTLSLRLAASAPDDVSAPGWVVGLPRPVREWTYTVCKAHLTETSAQQ